jgi:hypothetical protein
LKKIIIFKKAVIFNAKPVNFYLLNALNAGENLENNHQIVIAYKVILMAMMIVQVKFIILNF